MDGHYYYKSYKQEQSICITEEFRAFQKDLELNIIFSSLLKLLFLSMFNLIAFLEKKTPYLYISSLLNHSRSFLEMNFMDPY
jgi:hypothetical protein